MIFRQLFDRDTYTYTYLLGDENSGEALLIDPVLEHLEAYLSLLRDLDLRLVMAADTHVHADHITALGELRTRTQCQTYLGRRGDVACADNGLEDGSELEVGCLTLRVMYTPGHTDDSYCFYLAHGEQKMVFTGDTLLIRGSGRTDFQNGNAAQLYHSLHEKVLTLPNETLVYPGHDYKGWTQSTIEEEKRCNPRILVNSEAAFIDVMANLNLPDPKWMDVAVPANRACGKSEGAIQ